MSTLDKLMKELIAAADGLLVISETDAPLEPFVWPAPLPLSSQAILAASEQSSETPVQTLDLMSFFTPYASERDWHGDEERTTVKRFYELLQWLETNLTEQQVYRVGSTSIDVYIVGKTETGRYLGLTTRLVETG